MALYLDTSCLLKVFFPEAETSRTLESIASESRVVVSSLARLEALVHIHARVAARLLSAALARRLVQRIDVVLRTDPYDLVICPARIIEVAEVQIRPMVRSAHCRTLDRLHLATMETLGLRRLLTNDDVQARAARALDFDVTLPR